MPSSPDSVSDHLRQRLDPSSIVQSGQPLAKKTTLRVGGKADIYVEPAHEADLATVLRVCRDLSLPVTLLGRGSNLLIRDGGIRGVVVCLAQPAFSHIVVEGERLRCGAGARLKAVSVEARRAGLTGLEFLEGIPGSVGGALRMNAGAMGVWTFHVVESIRYMTPGGEIEEHPAAEVESRYRCCPILKTHVALSAVLRGTPSTTAEVAARMSAYSSKRWESQPAQPSAGCVFKNPAAVPAGKLIDELGLKGTRVGGAVVSDVHGNFIVNEGDATAADVLKLIETVRERIRAARGIEMETEVEILGEDLPLS
ncbi:MAG: UDP-N-acetylmuramate dehydrogenase [Verrucomicrobiales bacterium]|nr:UDP-N-acetylmuramate dehydrogenase [Verrucomicrobiales bacterium]